MELQEHIPLAPHTGYKIGGPARFFTAAKTAADVAEALRYAKNENLPYFILGSGTNVLLPDSGFEGLVIKNQIKTLEVDGDLLVVGTGCTLVEVRQFGLKQGRVGLEKLATVPGTVGGALYSNAHWKNDLLSNYVVWVEIASPNSTELIRLSGDELQFAYDASVFRKEPYYATRCAFRLPHGDTTAAQAEFLSYLKERGVSQPYGAKTAGCVFQNVPQTLGPGHHGTSAGWLIEQTGMKGASEGGISVSAVHANFFVNDGTGTSHDVETLITRCREAVYNKYGVHLELEINVVS
jgi:UDP-N-acetylmuramate dehydrogenase